MKKIKVNWDFEHPTDAGDYNNLPGIASVPSYFNDNEIKNYLLDSYGYPVVSFEEV